MAFISGVMLGTMLVFLTRIDMHAAWANAKAIELAGITRETEDPEGGEIVRVGSVDELTRAELVFRIETHEAPDQGLDDGSLKRRLSQQLKLRGHADFENVEAYQAFVDQVVAKLNRRSHSRFAEEKQALQPLPGQDAADYQSLSVKVTRSATIEVRRVVYTVPSRLIGERVQVRLHHDRLVLLVGQHPALTLSRVYPKPGEDRARSINYQHVIRSLASKPQAFRYSQLRDDLLPDAVSKDALVRWPRFALHHIGLCRFDPEGESGEPIGDQVDPQDLEWQEG